MVLDRLLLLLLVTSLVEAAKVTTHATTAEEVVEIEVELLPAKRIATTPMAFPLCMLLHTLLP